MRADAIQWELVRRRLQASEAALQETLTRNPLHIAQIWRRRAIELAGRSRGSTAAAGGVMTLGVRVGTERYAVELAELAEVLPYRNCTPVPGAPAALRGVINLRGELRPLIDLGAVLSGNRGDDGGYVVILRREGAWKVDGMEDLREIDRKNIAPAGEGRLTRGFVFEAVPLLDSQAVWSAAFPS